jgi:hypothetical protein
MNANEQERADRLSREIDRLLDGETVSGDDPLLEVASRLSQLPLQSGSRAADAFEAQVTAWFGAPAAQPAAPKPRLLRVMPRRLLLIGLAAALLIIPAFGLLVGGGITRRPTATAVAIVPTQTVTPIATSSLIQTQATATHTSTAVITATIATTIPTITQTVTLPATPVIIACGGASPDDSDELPIILNITGEVQAVTDTTAQINGLTVQFPGGVPAQSGASTTIRANLCNNDLLIALAPSDAIPTSTPAGTPIPRSTIIAALPTLPVLNATPAGCDAIQQPLAALLAESYQVEIADVTGWRCRGFTFGVIARAYALTESGKSVPVETVLQRRPSASRPEIRRKGAATGHARTTTRAATNPINPTSRPSRINPTSHPKTSNPNGHATRIIYKHCAKFCRVL